jgi:PKD repeat protein
MVASSCLMLFNRAPQADFLVSSSEGAAPLDVTFDASVSSDPDGALASYNWTFGDGLTGAGMEIVHRYAEPGTYVVRLTVKDDDGRADSAEQSILVRSATNYAIIVGLAAYYYAPCLYFTDDDVLAVRQALLSSPGWDEENVTFLLNADATSWNFIAALDDLDAADENDLLFIFFSGHGGRVPDDDPGEEADGYDEVLYLHDRAWITDDALERFLAHVPMRRIVVMVDSCFSGGQLGEGEIPVDPSGWSADWSADLGRASHNHPQDLDSLTKSIVAVTASRETEYSWELRALEHGVFTYSLLEALSGIADEVGDRDGFVSAEECYAYVAPRVLDLISSIDEEQHPQLLDLCEGELEFFQLPGN